ncbi:hypothetical protein HZ326_13049 [Fusarium oxysporum f. sp. albedinis]|nr:hypothetical protein HZ326_13049 [Fusarium oxysporum f. sp. albedinis]
MNCFPEKQFTDTYGAIGVDQLDPNVLYRPLPTEQPPRPLRLQCQISVLPLRVSLYSPSQVQSYRFLST